VFYSQVRLEVITGRGSRGKAKIKPALTASLERAGLNYVEANPGSVEFILKKNFNGVATLNSGELW